MCTIQVAALPPTGDTSLQQFAFRCLKDVGLFFFSGKFYLLLLGALLEAATVKPAVPDAKTWTHV